MNFYQKIFATFYLANTSTKNILSKSEHDFIESAKDTALLYLSVNWLFSFSNIVSLIGLILPDVEKIMRGEKLYILLPFLITALPVHYFCLTKNHRYKAIVEKGDFEGINWKRRLLYYGLFFVFQIALLFVFIYYAN